MMKPDYPLLIVPRYMDYLWGGDRIRHVFGRHVPSPVCAESWEISDRSEGMGVVANGTLAGTDLASLMSGFAVDLAGTGCIGSRFPLLIKIIDARLRLSVQVHPGDSTAVAGGEPKTEMWYALASGPGARVYAGFKPGVTRQSFESTVSGDGFEGILNDVQLGAGDAILIQGGVVHCIGEGCLLLEVQQNSNTTYRVYDWGRTDPAGKPRQLHVREALSTIDWSARAPRKAEPTVISKAGGNTIMLILECRHFRIEKLELGAGLRVANDGRSFHALFAVDGRVGIEASGVQVEAGPGTSCLMPACAREYVLSPIGGSAKILRISLPSHRV